MADPNSSLLSVLGKYILLSVISYFVTLYVTQNRLDKNQMLLIAFAITILFAFIDLYSGLFTGMFSALCNCPQITAA